MELKRRFSKLSIETNNSVDGESKIKAFNIDDVGVVRVLDDEFITMYGFGGGNHLCL